MGSDGPEGIFEMAKKKAEKGTYSRERDAAAAAKKQGLKDEEFEIVSGPKGFSIRKKRMYKKVEGAKLHGLGQPDSPVEPGPSEGIFVPTDVQYIHLEKSTGRFRFEDETGGYSNQSFETKSEAKIAWEAYCHNVLGSLKDEPIPSTPQEDANSLGGHPDDEDSVIEDVPSVATVPKDPDSDVDEEQMTHSVGDGCQPPHPPVETDRAPRAEPRMCSCNQVVPTWVDGDGILRYIEHPTEPGMVDPICNDSEEPVKNIPVKLTPADFPAGVQASIVARTENATPGGTTPATRLKKSIVSDPSKSVWHIADEMFNANPDTKRKDVIKRCTDSGIAFYTARTQYQEWFKTRRESAQHAAEANSKQS